MNNSAASGAAAVVRRAPCASRRRFSKYMKNKHCNVVAAMNTLLEAGYFSLFYPSSPQEARHSGYKK